MEDLWLQPVSETSWFRAGSEIVVTKVAPNCVLTSTAPTTSDGSLTPGRDREYSLRESEVRTLTDLGKIRVVPEDDLARLGYQCNYKQMESDIRSLTCRAPSNSASSEMALDDSAGSRVACWNPLWARSDRLA
jgi:hypothetical protein